MDGSFFCIEGPDGCGKEVQSNRLVSKLEENGFQVVFFEFPQYEKSFFGKMAGEMLGGNYGPMENIDPHLASLPYAFDRWQASGSIKRELSKGKIVVANRFSLSNLAHQAARMPADQREDFIKFVLKLENEVLGIPTPDLYLHLDVPVEISQKLIAGKLQRKYLRDGNFDLLEKDLNHQIEAARMYRELSNRIPNLVRIDCCDGSGNLRSIDEIQTMVWGRTIEHLHSILERQKEKKGSMERKENIHSNGHVEIICGEMFAGKSEELIRRLRRAIIARQKIQVFKPSVDKRRGESTINTCNGDKFPAISVENSDELAALVDADTKVIAIDEAQFFDPGIIKVVRRLANSGKRVIVAGLDKNFKGEPFGPMAELLVEAEYVDKLHAICEICGEEASVPQRLVNGKPANYNDPVVMVGEKESYIAVCRHCHKVPGAPE